ncbi:M16 family metallopeptidase [Thermoflavifilum thermophilum]|uniref:Predicted Zn-dependent peptidase n=1 Tax=Thermoflavifilum thermophilum TaxID=1393122 RepID=A0A1I7NIH4_9BACT|nr:pitrilysin family protein [Thermoflavifilum thermophilum]SFV34464.1 Predicted Zn-dependent peptidase [Thermoflavifilum thermophilum]
MQKISVLLLFILLNGITAFAQIDRSHPPAAGPAPEIHIGTPDTFTLDNGLKVFVVENHKLPWVTATLILDHPPVREGEKAGYVSMAGQMLRTGTLDMNKQQLDDTIDFLGGNIRTSSSSATAFSLSKNFPALFAIFSDIVLHPSFDTTELEKLRKQTLSSLAQQKDNPNAILSHVTDALTYGKQHPYGEIETEQTVSHINRDDLVQYYQTYWRPNTGYLAFVGDITPQQAREVTQKYLAHWQPAPVPHPIYPFPEQPKQLTVAIVNRPTAVQSNIAFANPIDLKPGDMRNFPAMIMNEILGGGSNSRLFMDLRETHGYTYGAYSSLSNDPYVGIFRASTAVRTEVTDSAISRLLADLQDMRTKPVTEDELTRFRNALSGSFARSLENPSIIAQFAINIERYHMPRDYYQHYLQYLAQVNAEQVQKAAEQFIQPDHAYVIVVGNAKQFADKLKAFGKLEYYSVYADPVTPDTTTQAPQGISATDVINHYLTAIGGKEKLQQVKSFSQVAEGEIQGQQVRLTEWHLQDQHYMQELSLPSSGMVITKITMNKDSIRMQQMGQQVALTPQMKQQIQQNAKWCPELTLLNQADKLTLTTATDENGKQVYAIQYTQPNGTITYQYDPQTGLKLHEIHQVQLNDRTLTSVYDFSDYRQVKGLQLPYEISTSMGPQRVTFHVTQIQINEGLNESDFL